MRIPWFLLLLVSTSAPASTEPREGFIAADDGTRLYYRLEGSGPEILVVVHGGPGGSLESVRPDFARLAVGRTVIYYDQRGNGRSDLVDDEERVGISHQVADLEAVRRHFKLEKMNLLGNSWGGFLIAAYAAEHPDRVARLVLDVPAPPTLRQLAEMSRELDRRIKQRLSEAEFDHVKRLYREWHVAADPLRSCRAFYRAVLLAYAHDPNQVPPIKGQLCAGNPEAVRRQQLVNKAIWRSLGEFDYRPKVKAVAAPALVIHGESDSIPLQGSEDWAASFSNGRLLVVQRTGHLAHLEQPDQFFEAVDRFLSGKWPDGARDHHPSGAAAN